MSVIKRTAYQLSLVLNVKVSLTDLVINEFNKLASFYGFRKGSRFTGVLITVRHYFEQSKRDWREKDITAASILIAKVYQQVLKDPNVNPKQQMELLIKEQRHHLKMSLEASMEVYRMSDTVINTLLKAKI